MSGFTWFVGLGTAAVVAQVVLTRLRRQRGTGGRNDTGGSSGSDNGWLWFGDFSTSDDTGSDTDNGGDSGADGGGD